MSTTATKRTRLGASSVITATGLSATSKTQKKISDEQSPIWRRKDGSIDWYLYDMHNTSEEDALDSFSSGSYYGLY